MHDTVNSVEAELAQVRRENASLQARLQDLEGMAEAFRKERDRAELYIDMAGSMIVVLDREGCVARINKMGCDTLQMRESEIIGHNWFDLSIPKDERDAIKKVFAQLMNGEIEPVDVFENRILTKHGEQRIVSWHNAVLRGHEGQIVGTLSSGRDLTQQKRMEAALRQGDRLEAVGSLAENVSQNFGNVLAAIEGYAASLIDSLIPDTRPHRQARRIAAATQHAMELTKRLMNVARASAKGQIEVRPVALAAMLDRSCEMLEHLFVSRNVTIDIRNRERLPHVLADPDQLMDVLMSILTNATEAMPNGGTITLDHVHRHIARPKMNPDAEGGAFVGIRIRDTGHGMSRGVLRSVFEPLFTTKASPSSLGLGLPLAVNMTRAMGGWIDVRSREGTGTVFRVFLREPVESGDADKAAVGGGASRHVLVVDDSEEDLLLMKETLEAHGYVVHAAPDAEAGLKTLDAEGKRLSAIVVDFLLQSGVEPLLEIIMRRNPRVRVVVTSGFSRDYVRERVSFSAWAFLQKPFEPPQLIEALNTVLAQQD